MLMLEMAYWSASTDEGATSRLVYCHSKIAILLVRHLHNAQMEHSQKETIAAACRVHGLGDGPLAACSLTGCSLVRPHAPGAPFPVSRPLDWQLSAAATSKLHTSQARYERRQ